MKTEIKGRVKYIAILVIIVCVIIIFKYNIEIKTSSSTNIEEQSNTTITNISYPSDAYTEGVLDPEKLESKEALNIGSDLILVNKLYQVNKDYVPNLVDIEGYSLQPQAKENYLSMKEAAKSAGVSLSIGSAYRSFEYQEELFKSYMAQDSYSEVLTYSAYPGTSEHQTGLVIDFTEYGSCDYTKCFEETESGKWLKNNAYKYGFILRYPLGKEDITGYMYEPWHYRYVGKEAAKEIYEHNITLEEYILL